MNIEWAVTQSDLRAALSSHRSGADVDLVVKYFRVVESSRLPVQPGLLSLSRVLTLLPPPRPMVEKHRSPRTAAQLLPVSRILKGAEQYGVWR